MTIEQTLDQRRLIEPLEVSQPGGQARAIGSDKWRAREQSRGDLGHRRIGRLLGQKGCIVAETLRVEQMQATEMTGTPELLRGGRQEQDTGGALGQRGDQAIVRTSPSL